MNSYSELTIIIINQGRYYDDADALDRSNRIIVFNRLVNMNDKTGSNVRLSAYGYICTNSLINSLWR